MKKRIAILFLFTMLLQAIPVLHFFCDKSEVFFTTLDEDKPTETKAEKEKKEPKDCPSFYCPLPETTLLAVCYLPVHATRLPSPFIETLKTPPNA